MPSSVDTYQALREQYNQLPWYKKVGFWFSAPRLAWGLFGYKQTPSEGRIGQLIALAKSAWFYKTEFERAIYRFFTSQNSIGEGKFSGRPIAAAPVSLIACYAPVMAEANLHAAASSRCVGIGAEERQKKITIALLKAVAYGMESSNPAVNMPIKLQDVTFSHKDSSGAPMMDKAGKPVTAQLFNPNLHAKSLLRKSPEFLLERGDVTDWAGRTFQNITAFEYALWAKDFKMIKMMLKCIPATPEGDAIRAALFEQSKQVKAPVHAGGGLTYTHTYDRPNLDAAGIPDVTTTTVTEKHTENHFNLTPLCDAYRDYETNFHARTWPQRDAYWVKLIGKQQRFLPVHILQRYCDPDRPLYPLPQFNNAFKRSMDFYNWDNLSGSSLFGSPLSSNFALCGACAGEPGAWARWRVLPARPDAAAIRRLDEVSTIEMEKIIQQLSQPQRGAGLRL